MAVNTNTNITRQAPFLEDKISNLLSSTQTLIDQPYDQYGGTRVAGFAGDQLDAFGLARQGIGAYTPYLAAAGDYGVGAANNYLQNTQPVAQGMVAGSTGYNVDPYMNPYTQNVIDTTMLEMNRQQEMDQDKLDAAAAQAAAFGGSRHGVAEAEMQRGFDQNRTSAIANLYNQGYTNAQQAQEQHMNRLAQAGQLYGALGEAGSNIGLDTSRIMSGLGGLAQQYNQADATMLAQIGGMQQGQEQALMDIDYNNFLEQQMQPYQRLGFFSDILHGVPTSSSTLTATSTPQKSALSQGLGALGQFASTGQTFGWWGGDSPSASSTAST